MDVDNQNQLASFEKTLSKMQARFRGRHSRKVYSARVLRGERVCPHYRTPVTVIQSMLDGANVGSADLVLDLGCGSGVILVEAALRGAQCAGFDIDAVLLQEAKRRCENANVGPQVDLALQDLLCVNFSLASVILIFLVPSMLEILSKRFRAELQSGVRIAAYHFPLPGDDWVPHFVENGAEHPLKQGFKTNLFFYISP